MSCATCNNNDDDDDDDDNDYDDDDDDYMVVMRIPAPAIMTCIPRSAADWAYEYILVGVL